MDQKQFDKDNALFAATGKDWREAHMDKLVERAVKAEMQRDELLRAIKSIKAAYHRYASHYDKAKQINLIADTAIRKIEEQNNAARQHD